LNIKGVLQDMKNNELTIALVAHDRKKMDLVDWFKKHIDQLVDHKIIATGTTGRLLKNSINNNQSINIETVKSGPFGGDQQVGAMIASNNIDALIFLEDVLTPQPHDVDIKALLRLAVLYEVPVACNRATADILIASPIFFDKKSRSNYPDIQKEFERYLKRKL